MGVIADAIYTILSNTKPAIVEKTQKPSRAQSITEERAMEKSASQIRELLQSHPLYPEIQLVSENELMDVK